MAWLCDVSRENIPQFNFPGPDGYDELTDGVGQKDLGAPRPVAHDELTNVAMHCVHSFIG